MTDTMWSGVAVAVVVVLLVGCSYVNQQSPCGAYEDPVWQGFCEADLIIESAQALVEDYEAQEVVLPEVAKMRKQVDEAEQVLNKASRAYINTGKIVEGDSVALEQALKLVEVWANGS
jgi:hypothetical protein